MADLLCINFQSVNIMIGIGYFPCVCILIAYIFLAIVSDAFVLSHAYLMVGLGVNSWKVYVKMQQTNIPPFCFTS